MKVEFVKSSYTVYEQVKVDGVYQRPRIECTLTCKCHLDINTSDFIINGIYGSGVLNNIETRLTQGGYDYDFVTNVICGREFKVTADTQVKPEDVYDENIGRHIAETKARSKVFKIMSIIMSELEKYYRQANAEIAKMSNKSSYLYTREKNHLNDIFAKVETLPASGAEAPAENPAE